MFACHLLISKKNESVKMEYMNKAAASMSQGAQTIFAYGAAGAAAVPLAGITANALVSPAMTYFGTVVPGVGTLHAAGGVAAKLQSTSAVCASPNAIMAGGVVGVAVGIAAVYATTNTVSEANAVVVYSKEGRPAF